MASLDLLTPHLSKIKIAGPQQLVYKDECVYSFDNPESDRGLYISLVSFLGFGRNYVEQYFQKTGNAVFLHLKRNKEPVPEPEKTGDGPEKKTTRLAIGVEGGFDPTCGKPNFIYTNSYSVVVLPGFNTYPWPNPSLPEAVNKSVQSVIDAESPSKIAGMAAMVDTWDGEKREVSVVSISVQDDPVSVEQTPGGRIRRVQDKPSVPLVFDAVERVEALDMSEEETEELIAVNPKVDVRPSTSGLTASASRAPERDYGSDLDSDYDEEFDELEILKSCQNLPDMEQLEVPMREIVSDIDTGMDNAADRLLGTSTSFSWVSDFESFRGVREYFSGPTPGPLKDYDSPYDTFIDIWDKDIIDLIVRETNRYAQQTIETKRREGTLKPCSRLRFWTDTNADEIMVLFAVFMYMAIDSRTSVAEYWTFDEVLQLRGFRRLMSYNRYVLLNKFLHFVDNDADANQQLLQTGGSDSARLFKLCPIIKHLEKKFKSLYNLGPNLSIDESLTLFKGCLSWVQTIRSKAARFGIKSFELCESNTGYMAAFQIYTGKVDRSVGDSSLAVNLGGKTTKVVLELLQGLEQRGHCVVMDNFYNCPALARYLKSLGFDCFGTLRVCRRNVPSDIAKVPKKVSKGTIISRHCGDLSIIAWMDSKMVNVISTYHRPDTYNVIKAGKRIEKPVCVRDYNACMGGVDLKDQKLSMYLLERKRGMKWYMKMFKRLMNVSIHNALVMYVSSLKRRDKLPVTHREFRYELASALLRRHRSSQAEINRPVGDLMRLRRDIVHEPDHMKGQKGRARCVICYRKKETKMVHSKCIQCDVYLCFRICWKIWHSAEKLPGEDIHERKRRRK